MVRNFFKGLLCYVNRHDWSEWREVPGVLGVSAGACYPLFTRRCRHCGLAEVRVAAIMPIAPASKEHGNA